MCHRQTFCLDSRLRVLQSLLTRFFSPIHLVHLHLAKFGIVWSKLYQVPPPNTVQQIEIQIIIKCVYIQIMCSVSI